MSLFQSSVIAKVTDTVLTFFIYNDTENELNLNPIYQRDYVWDKLTAQALFHTIFSNLPMGAVSVVIDDKADKYVEVVDGKQRLTTLLDFVSARKPAYKSKTTGLILHPDLLHTDDAEAFYFNDLNPLDKRKVKHLKIPCVELTSNDENPVSELDKLKYFHRVNFSGLPISTKHREHVESLIQQHQELQK